MRHPDAGRGPSGPGPLRVLHVLEAVRGGTSRHVLDIVRHARGVGHTVAVAEPAEGGSDDGSGAAYDHRAVEAMAQSGARIVELPMARTPWAPTNGAALIRLRRLMASEHPDVVHGHSSVGGALARLAGGTGPAPVLYTANGLARSRPYVMVERVLGRLTDRWIAVSASEAEQALRLELVEPGRLAVVPNGIDLQAPPPAADLRASLGIGSGVQLVGTVARLVEQKSPERFVRIAAAVAARHPGAHFVLIGMGPLQSRVDDEVAAAGLGDRWHQIHHLDDAAAALSQLDAFVLASEFEGAPYTPLEAMRAGVPAILSDVVGNRDTVVDGISGVLRDRRDTAGMAEAVVRVLNEPAYRLTLTDGASERLARHFDAVAMGRRLEALYAEVAALYAGIAAGGEVRRSTRRLPQPIGTSSVHSPDSIAAQ